MTTEKLYSKKENRDQAAHELKSDGYTVKKFSVRNQRLHPMYIEDQKHTVAGQGIGFGNDSYLMSWGTLYGLKFDTDY